MMSKQNCARACAAVFAALSLACSGVSPTSPTSLASEGFDADAGLASTSGIPTVSLQSNSTASPSSVSIAVKSRVLFVNNSGQYVRLQSYNCSEFSLIGLPAGASKHTMPFNAAKTCEYFTWDSTRTKQLFKGTVSVR